MLTKQSSNFDKSDTELNLQCTTPCMIHILVRLTPDSKGKPTRDEKHLVFLLFFLTTLTLFWLCSCHTSQIQQPLGGKSITFAVVKSRSCTAEVCNLKTPTLTPNSEQPLNNKRRFILFLLCCSLFLWDRFTATSSLYCLNYLNHYNQAVMIDRQNIKKGL